MLRSLAVMAVVTATAPLAAQVDSSWICPFRGSVERLAQRPSPLDSLTFSVMNGQQNVKVCYGRPSARGRTMIGGEAVPFGRIWRTGANETTKIHTRVALTIAGIRVEPGTYALYTVPGENEWQVVVNRAWQQWGQEGTYTPEVEAQEVGRATVPVERLDDPIETFTIRAEPNGDHAATLIIEWERTRIRIPVNHAM